MGPKFENKCYIRYYRLERDLNTEYCQKNGSVKRFVRFQTSNLIEDVGQSTIPKFDAQKTSSDPKVPLSGIGLDYKNGFLKLKLLTYDSTRQPLTKWVILPETVRHHLETLDSLN